MAKSKQQDLLDSLRKRMTRSQPEKGVKRVVKELRSLADEIEDRAKGGPAKRKASAKKGVATRKRKAAARSASAKKGARTRAKSKA